MEPNLSLLKCQRWLNCPGIQGLCFQQSSPETTQERPTCNGRLKMIMYKTKSCKSTIEGMLGKKSPK